MKTFKLFGNPLAQKRPRVTRFSTYDPLADQKKEHKSILRDQRGTSWKFTNNPLKLTATFFMPIPISYKKKIVSNQDHIKRPDIDNLIKYLLDVANDVIFSDDSHISVITAKKIYDTNPRTEFTVEELFYEENKETTRQA